MMPQYVGISDIVHRIIKHRGREDKVEIGAALFGKRVLSRELDSGISPCTRHLRFYSSSKGPFKLQQHAAVVLLRRHSRCAVREQGAPHLPSSCCLNFGGINRCKRSEQTLFIIDMTEIYSSEATPALF